MKKKSSLPILSKSISEMNPFSKYEHPNNIYVIPK